MKMPGRRLVTRMKPAKPIAVPDDIAGRYTRADQFERFDAAVSKVLSVPYVEIKRRVDAENMILAQHPRRRGRPPKVNPSA
jgi:hypothetical protein